MISPSAVVSAASNNKDQHNALTTETAYDAKQASQRDAQQTDVWSCALGDRAGQKVGSVFEP